MRAPSGEYLTTIGVPGWSAKNPASFGSAVIARNSVSCASCAAGPPIPAALGRLLRFDRDQQCLVAASGLQQTCIFGREPTRERLGRTGLGETSGAVRLVAFAGGLVALVHRNTCGDECHDQQQCECRDATTRESSGAAVLADVFAFEVVFGDAVHRRREIGDRGAEAAVAQIEIGLVARAHRKSRWRASSRNAPRKAGGTAVESAVKSFDDASHSQVPSVTTGRR